MTTSGSSSDAIFFIFVSLITGALFRHLLKHSRIPYTIWLLFFGMALGVLQRAFPESGVAGRSLELASNMDPHLLLYVFLPPLIFESAYTIDSMIFEKTITKSLVLALPGVVFSLYLIAGVASICFPDWSWDKCLLLGAILSATDPVSVVSLLKTMGAPKSLSSLIESEALLNDGTSVVIFLTLHRAVQPHMPHESEVEVVLNFVRMALGGVAFGMLSSVILLEWLDRVFNDAAVEITITLSSAYLVFYLAEAQLQVSGVLAVVALGLCFSRFGVTTISPEVQHFLHEFWHMLEYLANTLVFVITGLIIVLKTSSPTPQDMLSLAVMYVALTVIRTTMLFLCLPVFQRLKYGFSWKEALICSWGGLRGAVGLALGLVIRLDTSIEEAHRQELMFQIAGMVILTLVINGATMGPLIRRLGLLEISAIKHQMRARSLERLQERLDHDIDDLKKSPFYSNANWDIVHSYATLPQEQLSLNETLLDSESKIPSSPRNHLVVGPGGHVVGTFRYSDSDIFSYSHIHIFTCSSSRCTRWKNFEETTEKASFDDRDEENRDGKGPSATTQVNVESHAGQGRNVERTSWADSRESQNLFLRPI